MAQSASSSSIVYKNEDGILCKCNGLARIEQAWTEDNPGRRFYTCKSRIRKEACGFFRWYDVEKPHGWQHLALCEARDTMKGQKEEIKYLRDVVKALSHEKESDHPSSTDEDLKLSREECESLRREVEILNERSRVYRNVLITSTVGFVVVLGVIVSMGK
ncbi:hypothetical protein Rs2_50476 [Raphanus sativus]|uniref:Uncharacterized protein LOC108850125 n=1 Tax=Raphanus sativus TaxID=3726 RepID=A0A6J0N3H9_RAPSA|nr:uncharacterized protein LOC108850125 [Raphanus sativus]KAJ4867983.1 hypothetical protein Rs2_50476 [Raphanus sativus]